MRREALERKAISVVAHASDQTVNMNAGRISSPVSNVLDSSRFQKAHGPRAASRKLHRAARSAPRGAEPGATGRPRAATARGMGRAAERPGLARMRFVEIPFRRRRTLRVVFGREPSGRGFLTRSDRGPRRAEGIATPSGPHGRFQPMPVALLDPSPPGFRPMFQGTCPDPSRGRSLKTPDQRFPLDHP